MSATTSGPKRRTQVHVEKDVQQAAVQPRRAQQRPPRALNEYRIRPAHAEQQQRTAGRRENRHPAPRDLDVAAGREQRQGVEQAADADDQRNESQIGAELPKDGPESPQAGIRSAAAVALVVANAHERSARWTDHRSACSTLKHCLNLLPWSWQLGARPNRQLAVGRRDRAAMFSAVASWLDARVGTGRH